MLLVSAVFLIFCLMNSVLKKIKQETSSNVPAQTSQSVGEGESEAQLVTLSGLVTEVSAQTVVVSLNEYGKNAQKQVSVTVGNESVVYFDDGLVVEFSKIKKGDYVSVVLEVPVSESLLGNVQLRAKDIYISEAPKNI